MLRLLETKKTFVIVILFLIVVIGVVYLLPSVKSTNVNEPFSNSNSYTHSVNMPINDPVSCNNFCGPTSTCSITGEQCSADVDCQGCQPTLPKQQKYTTEEVAPYNTSLPNNNFYKGFQYNSPLIHDFASNFAQAYPNSKKNVLTNSYQGLDTWTKSFNEGLNLYNKKREITDKYNSNPKLLYYEPKYISSVSATGQFYETTPPAANS